MSRRSLIVTGAIGLSTCLFRPAGAALIYDFDTGGVDNGQDLDGWTHTLGGPSVPVNGGRGASVGGGGGAGQEDGPHPNLVFSSPAFFLDNSGPLTFQLHGGEGQGGDPATTFYPNLAAVGVGRGLDVGDRRQVRVERGRGLVADALAAVQLEGEGAGSVEEECG